jgi:hypothetical protein
MCALSGARRPNVQVSTKAVNSKREVLMELTAAKSQLVRDAESVGRTNTPRGVLRYQSPDQVTNAQLVRRPYGH